MQAYYLFRRSPSPAYTSRDIDALAAGLLELLNNPAMLSQVQMVVPSKFQLAGPKRIVGIRKLYSVQHK